MGFEQKKGLNNIHVLYDWGAKRIQHAGIYVVIFHKPEESLNTITYLGFWCAPGLAIMLLSKTSDMKASSRDADRLHYFAEHEASNFGPHGRV